MDLLFNHDPNLSRRRKSKIGRLKKRTFCVALLAAWFAVRASADVLDDWNDAVLNAIRKENTPPPLAARNLAIVHLAIYDAVNSIERTHEPYLTLVPCGPASSEIAAAAAGYRAAAALFPSQQATFDALWRRDGVRSKSEQERTNGVAIGFLAADALLERRAFDGAQTTLTYFPSNQPGAWRRTPPFHRPPELPQWCSMKPFALVRCDQFRPAPPPKLVSADYARDFNEVKRLGAKNSTERSTYETETVRFWSDFTGTVTPPGHWNQIARIIGNDEGLSLYEKARLLALLNSALADAGIVAWDAKYKFNFWRPITAIHRAAEDENPDTISDADWQPMLVTPAFPEYVSGHSTFSAAAAEVLTRYFGRNEIRFSIGNDSLPTVFRRYERLSAVVEEIGHSRILGGIHFPSADRNGQRAGSAVGAYVCGHILQPIANLKNAGRVEAPSLHRSFVAELERQDCFVAFSPANFRQVHEFRPEGGTRQE